MSIDKLQSFGQRCRHYARVRPDQAAIIYIATDGNEQITSRKRLDQQANRMARLLQAKGVDRNSLVIVALPDCVEHYIAIIAAWRLGACTLPLSPKMPATERNRMLELAGSWRPVVIVGDWQTPDTPSVEFAEMANLGVYSSDPIEEIVPQPGKAIGSGGSTGRPKIIVDPKPWAHIPGKWGLMQFTGLRSGQRQLVVGRLYHNVGFYISHIGLFEGHTLVVTPRFDAAAAVDLIERYKIQFMGILPIMMQRIAKLPNIESRDFSSIEGMYHAGAACPQWVKQLWLKLVAPKKVWEIFGTTEEKGNTAISGDEWLQRPGSVGQPYQSEIRIVDESGAALPDGQVGEIYMRNIDDPAIPQGGTWPQEPTCDYVGAPPPVSTEDGFVSLGDMGWLDDDGFLQIADRRVDMIVSGGANVYPAEVESVLSGHPEVADVVVIGVPDVDWGSRVHALVQPAIWPCSLTVPTLDRFCREQLTSFKLPKSYELVRMIPRDPSGKIRRMALREERRSGWTDAMIGTQSTTAGTHDNAG